MSSTISLEGVGGVETDFPVLQNDRFLRAAHGQPVDRVPVWMMRQAGRYLPEFRAMRAEKEFFEVCQTPKLACEITMQPIRRFDLDAAIIFSDILVIPQALGMKIQMIPGRGPVFDAPLQSPGDLDHLTVPTRADDLWERLSYVYEAITLTRHELQGRVPLIGFSGAPWTLMAYMIEGGGSKGFNRAKRWLFQYPNESEQLLDILADAVADHLIGQIRAGAQAVQIFDSWAGELTPEDFERFSWPRLRSISRRIRSYYSQMVLSEAEMVPPIILFAKGCRRAIELSANMSREDIQVEGFDVIGIDYSLSAEDARQLAGDSYTLQGNLDPVVLFAPDEVIERRVESMLLGFGVQQRFPLIANLGHGMLPEHDPSKANVFIEAVHKISEKLLSKTE